MTPSDQDPKAPRGRNALGDNTRLVTGGRRPEWTQGVVNPPVFRASTCLFETYADFDAGIADPDSRLFYGRRGTPTHWSLREALTGLEPNGHDSWLFPSGVSAITTALMAYCKPGQRMLLPDNVYEPIRSYAQTAQEHFGVETAFYPPGVGAGIADYLDDRTAVVLVETPGSLTFEVADVPAIAAAAHKVGATVIADNTWATPLYYEALSHGADVSVISCTKYVVGHSDVLMGSVTATARAWPKLKKMAVRLGMTASADDCALALRGLRTLGVRLAQHQASALDVAHWLAEQPEVAEVRHPALASCPGHEVFKRDFTGSTGLFGVVLEGGQESDVAAMIDPMKLFKIGFSWGGYESLVLPARPERVRTAEPWAAAGPVLRLHIGLEDVADLKADLADGLARFRAARDRAA
ncbi:cystathionine beta-lyase [Rhodothalassium salexigens]|uniref:cystathionine beta-lyase n=1 Tax=Rhodothalassium salexigens TaxID=1086 RepID=UPI0019119F09|nr:cystathionine beta-lyase [Rhodothalassium salexigens]MBK5910318.1 cystathionine beta-lyase [Rhodothalassium salexigens]MBK5921069.1 cystathionine beta-lyase [Rhodothalassium salexigens]